MRNKIMLMILIFAAALVIHVSAQNRPTKQSFDTRGRPLVGGQEANTPVTLCRGPILATEGTAKCLYQALPVSGKLHIETQDGAIHEIDMQTVRKMTLSDR